MTTTETPRKDGSLTGHALVLMFAKTLGFLFTLALPLVVVRRLDQVQFGLYKQAFLVVATASTILSMGFGLCAYYYLPRNPEKAPSVVLNILLFLMFMGSIGWGVLWFWPSTLGFIFHGPQLVPYGYRIGLMILLWTVGSFLEIVPIARGELGLAGSLIVAIQISRAALLVGAAVVFGTLNSLIDAAIAQGALQGVVLLVYLHSRFPRFWKAFDWQMMRAQLSYSIPLGLGGLLFTLQSNVDSYTVANRFGPAVFAVYAVGTTQLPFIGLLRESTNAVLIPIASRLQQQNQHRELLLMMARVMRKLAAVYFAVYALVLVAGPDLIVFLFGARYRSSWPVLAINITLLPMLVLPQEPLLRSYASERMFILRYRCAMVLILLASVWEGAVHFGPLGAVSAVIGVGILDRLFIAFHFGRLLNVRRGDMVLLKDTGKLAACSAAAALATAVVRWRIPHWRPIAILMLCGVVFSIVYAAAVWFAKVVTDDEWLILNHKVAEIRAATFAFGRGSTRAKTQSTSIS